MLKSLLFIISFVIVITFQTLEAKAAPGDYDPTFLGNSVQYQVPGGDGTSFMSRIEVQKDGKYLVAGQAKIGQTFRLVLRRHNANGLLDTSFGNNGEAVEQVSSTGYKYINLWFPSNIAVQSDGKILIGGTRLSYDRSILGIAVWRFTANGLLDKTFDGDGRKDLSNSIFPNFDSTARVETIRMTNTTVLGVKTPKILVLVTNYNTGDYGIEDALASSTDLIKLNLDGSYNTNFGSNGTAAFRGEFNDIALYKQPLFANDDLIYVAGIGEDDTLTVWRYVNDGFPDTTFGSNGRSSLPLEDIKRRFEHIAIQNDGRVLLAGDINITQGIIQSYIFRMNANGVFETQFGNTTFNGAGAIHYFDFNTSIDLQSDGKFIVGHYFGNLRYLSDGSPDTTYIPAGGDADLIFFLIQKDNKLVAVKNNWENGVGNTSYSLKRLLPN